MPLHIRVVLRGNGNKSPEPVISNLRSNWFMTALRPDVPAYYSQKVDTDPDNNPVFLAIAAAIRVIPLMWPDRKHPVLLEFSWADARNADTYKFLWSQSGGKDWHCLHTTIKAYEAKQKVETLANRFMGAVTGDSGTAQPMA